MTSGLSGCGLSCSSRPGKCHAARALSYRTDPGSEMRVRDASAVTTWVATDKKAWVRLTTTVLRARWLAACRRSPRSSRVLARTFTGFRRVWGVSVYIPVIKIDFFLIKKKECGVC